MTRGEGLERQRLVVIHLDVVRAGGALDQVPDALAQQFGDLFAGDRAARQPPRARRLDETDEPVRARFGLVGVDAEEHQEELEKRGDLVGEGVLDGLQRRPVPAVAQEVVEVRVLVEPADDGGDDRFDDLVRRGRRAQPQTRQHRVDDGRHDVVGDRLAEILAVAEVAVQHGAADASHRCDLFGARVGAEPVDGHGAGRHEGGAPLRAVLGPAQAPPVGRLCLGPVGYPVAFPVRFGLHAALPGCHASSVTVTARH